MIVKKEDIEMLEMLIKSPAFASLKRVISGYKDECHAALMSAKEANEMFEIRGRLIGLRAIETLPDVLVSQAIENRKRGEKKESGIEEIQRLQAEEAKKFLEMNKENKK